MKVNVIEYGLGFYIVISHPIYKPSHVFKIFALQSRPILVRDNLITIEPHKKVLGVKENSDQGEEFIELDHQTFDNECIKNHDSYFCPHLTKFQKNSHESCLFQLYKPNETLNDLLSICPLLLLPKKETIHEIDQGKFKFYHTTRSWVEVECPGNKINIVENLDSENIVKVGINCHMKLETANIRPAWLVKTTSSTKPYFAKLNWFDSIKPYEYLFPTMFIMPIDLNSFILSVAANKFGSAYYVGITLAFITPISIAIGLVTFFIWKYCHVNIPQE